MDAYNDMADAYNDVMGPIWKRWETEYAEGGMDAITREIHLPRPAFDTLVSSFFWGTNGPTKSDMTLWTHVDMDTDYGMVKVIATDSASVG